MKFNNLISEVLLVGSIMTLCGCSDNKSMMNNEVTTLPAESTEADYDKIIRDIAMMDNQLETVLPQDIDKDGVNSDTMEARKENDKKENATDDNKITISKVMITNGSNGKTITLESSDDIKNITDLLGNLVSKEYSGEQYSGWSYRFKMFDEDNNEVAVYTFSGDKYSMKENGVVKYYTVDNDGTYAKLMSIADEKM